MSWILQKFPNLSWHFIPPHGRVRDARTWKLSSVEYYRERIRSYSCDCPWAPSRPVHGIRLPSCRVLSSRPTRVGENGTWSVNYTAGYRCRALRWVPCVDWGWCGGGSDFAARRDVPVPRRLRSYRAAAELPGAGPQPKGKWLWRHKLAIWTHPYLEDLVQDCSNLIANTLELLQYCAKPSISFLPPRNKDIPIEVYVSDRLISISRSLLSCEGID